MAPTPAHLRAAFIKRIEAFCAHNGISEDKLGRLACNDQHAIPNLRRGTATLKRLEAINAVISGHTAIATKKKAA